MGCLDDNRIVASVGFQIDDADSDNIHSEDARFDEYQLRPLVGIVSHKFQQLLVNRNKSLKLQPHIIKHPSAPQTRRKLKMGLTVFGLVQYTPRLRSEIYDRDLNSPFQ